MDRVLVNSTLVGNIETVDLEGRPHLKIPTVMITEGVHTGSRGALLYPGEELAKTPSVWNHKPCVIYHPQNAAGGAVSACSEEVINTRKVGIPLATSYDENKLKTVSYLDVERLKTIDKRVYNRLKLKEKVEVSTGLDCDIEWTPGVWNGKPYVGIARNYRPDHLAILPDQVGACSIADGAGLLANSAGEEKEPIPVIVRDDNGDLVLHNAEGKETRVLMSSGLVLNELSFRDVSEELNEALAAKYGEPGKYWQGYVVDIYSDRVIFRSGNSEDGDGYLMLSYSVEGEDVKLGNDAQAVERSITYTTTTNAFVGNASGGLSPTPKESGLMDKKAFVTTLITNSGGQWVETDRTFLEGLDEAGLKKLASVKVVVIPAAEPATTNNAAPAVAPAVAPVHKFTLAEVVANSDPATQEMLAEMTESVTNERTRLVGIVNANPRNTFSPEALGAMKLKDLRAVALMAGPVQNMDPSVDALAQLQAHFGIGGAALPVSYLGAQGGGITTNAATTEEPLPMPVHNYRDPLKDYRAVAAK